MFSFLLDKNGLQDIPKCFIEQRPQGPMLSAKPMPAHPFWTGNSIRNLDSFVLFIVFQE